jgi:tetratricopeptide (TPR) repeat protein
MKRSYSVAVVRGLSCMALASVLIASTTNNARAQGSRFYFGPDGFGYGYDDGNVGIAIGSTPYDRRDEDDRRYDDRDVYEDDNYYAEPEAVEPPLSSIIETTDGAVEYQAFAEEAFRDAAYQEALRWSRHAVLEDTKNGKLHLFAAQTFFAVGDFGRAAAATQRGMSLLKKKDWGFVVENYADFYANDDYVDQMAKLVALIKKHPDVPFAYFLRGYHYGYLGHKKAAQKDLAKAVSLEQRDRLAGELLVAMGGELPKKRTAAAPKPPAGSAAVTTTKTADKAIP